MGIIDKAKKLFGYEVMNIGGYQRVYNPASRPVAGKRVTLKLVEFMQNLSNFGDMQDEDILEQLFIWEPEVGGALDKQSTLVAQCYKGPYLKDTDKTTDKLETDMLDTARRVCDQMHMADQFELYGEMLPLFGDVFIDIRDPESYKILPNKFITLVEKEEQIGTITAGYIMTQGDILVFNEQLPGQFKLTKDQFIHLKYKDTPLFVLDRKHRWTYGIYSISPVQRAIMSTWQKRQTSIIDTLYRWRIIPREIHSVNSEIFALDQFAGDQQGRLAQAQVEANKYITQYNAAIQDQAPDQGYTVLDTITISMLESKTNSYMKTNELMDQLDGKIWTALNMPESVVTGKNSGSYASELVISNYVSQKAMTLAQKIRPIMLENLRSRLKSINSAFPIDKLDIKLELSMAATELETFRQIAIMGTFTNCFTVSEIRAKAGYQPLTEQQKKEMAEAQQEQMKIEVDKANQITGAMGKNPETPQSNSQHKQDQGQQAVNKTQKT